MARKDWLNKNYRRVYRYICGTCGKVRFTFDKQRADEKMCRVCQDKLPPEGMVSMFDDPFAMCINPESCKLRGHSCTGACQLNTKDETDS